MNPFDRSPPPSYGVLENEVEIVSEFQKVSF